MKKLKAILIVGILIFFSYMLFSQEDTLYLNKEESIQLRIDVKPNPATVKILSEPLDRNEALQKVLELNVEESDQTNKNLKALNNTLQEMPSLELEAKNNMLDEYNIDLHRIAMVKHRAKMWGSVLSIIYILVFLSSLAYEDKTYWTKKKKTGYVLAFIGGLLVFGVVIPTMILTSEYELWTVIKSIF